MRLPSVFAAAGVLALAGTCLALASEAAARNSCGGLRIMNIVAHEDDDLLFMNPAIQSDIDKGHCVRTVYLTAGDAGGRESHWRRRERGVRDAYATMAGVRGPWTLDRVVYAGRPVTRAVLEGRRDISLIYLRLPDGHRDGSGFGATGHVSLQKLWDASIKSVGAVDGGSGYSRSALIEALREMMDDYSPDVLRIQDYENRYTREDYASHRDDGDHSDHHAAAYFAYQSQGEYRRPHEVIGYLGYPVRDRPVNARGSALSDKRAAFFAYAVWDENIRCRTGTRCAPGSPTSSWLLRQWHRRAVFFGGRRAGEAR